MTAGDRLSLHAYARACARRIAHAPWTWTWTITIRHDGRECTQPISPRTILSNLINERLSDVNTTASIIQTSNLIINIDLFHGQNSLEILSSDS